MNILGVDWDLCNIKEDVSGSLKKIDNIREAKKIYIEKCIKGKATLITRSEPFYRNDIVSDDKSLLKSGQRFENSKPVKNKKLKDVESLLRNSYGEERCTMNNMRWYKDLFTKYDAVETKDDERERGQRMQLYGGR